MAELLTLTDVADRLKLVMGFFDNDSTRFVIHLSRYLQKNPPRAKKAPLEKKVDQSNQDEKAREKAEQKSVTTNMEATTEDSSAKDGLLEHISSAFEKGDVDLLTILKTYKGPISSLGEAQRIRRASALGKIASNITSEDGRKMSALDKNLAVVDDAIKLAETEEKEDAQAEEEEFEQEEFAAEDEVVIIEGDNCGLFGTLQHSTTGIFAALDDTVKEDEDGYYGVDVHLNPGTDEATTEGFWIHPEALQHKKYEVGDEVYVTDGINVGRYGNTQSDNGRLQFDDGCYGVDVKMEDGSIEGYWIHPTSMIPANESPERKKDDEKKEEKKEEKDDIDADLEEIDQFQFLPYIAYPGDAMDEALADLLNVQEIDINIKRIVTNSGKVVYRYDRKRHLVRFIHGILLVKEGKEWTALAPILRKLVGKEPQVDDIFKTKKE